MAVAARELDRCTEVRCACDSSIDRRQGVARRRVPWEQAETRRPAYRNGLRTGTAAPLAVLLAILVVVALVSVTAAAPSRSGAPSAVIPPVSVSDAAPDFVVIPAGGTVWTAVAPYAPEGMAPHDWVSVVLEHNSVDPGSVVTIPAGAVMSLPAG